MRTPSFIGLMLSGMVFLLQASPGIFEMRAECLVWAKLENKTLPLQNQGHAKCLTNKECSGFTCAGVYQDKDLTFGMRVLPCRKVPGVEIYGYAPQFNAKNFSHIFTHKSQYVVPGALLNMSVIPGNISPSKFGELTGKIEVHLERNAANNTLILGLSAMACINDTCPFRKLVFNHTEIPVLSCPKQTLDDEEEHDNEISSSQVNTSRDNPECNVNELLTCGPNKVCVQLDPSKPAGICKCRKGFSQRNQDCMSRQPKTLDGSDVFINPKVNVFEKNKERPSLEKKASTDSKANGKDVNSFVLGGIVAGVICGLILLVLFIALIVSLTRLGPRLRAKMTRRPYEDIIIGDQSKRIQGTP
eukprot:TRINITY_DN4566_c0_g1_i2.p2 TRINITY_DN4566_c0_g1~~TRINITY_DN4566_c0_g1_i2.p2  ORF type:complete len:359 (-),score=69.22 TRINITY_DN4566_c0_g1_i2:1995-3071(-)